MSMGWEVLMKVVAQAISIYAIGNFKFSKDFCKVILSILVQNNPQVWRFIGWVILSAATERREEV